MHFLSMEINKIAKEKIKFKTNLELKILEK